MGVNSVDSWQWTVDSDVDTEHHWWQSINLLLLDSSRLAVITRELSEKEQTTFREQKIKYRSLKVGIDAVALITNKKNKDTLITLPNLKELLL